MANSSLTLTSLDFDTLKENFKTYLQSQSVVKDYDFDGSNINVLLDVMSYNSYLNSFYLNMIASEMFLDSAQKLESVISHAKELNYVPQSKRSSLATVNFTITCNGISGAFDIPKKTTFYGTNSNGFNLFTTSENITLFSPNNIFQAANLAIYDGYYHIETFIVDYSLENQRFLIPHSDVDISSLTVTVSENNVNTSFTKADTLYGLDKNSNVYFIQAAFNNKYEVVFGDALLGRRPINGATVYLDYRVCLGPAADGITDFNLAPDLGPPNGGSASFSSITASTPSAYGANAETIETVRFRAPRYFATQQRAVSSDDYASLVLAKFGGDVEDVIIYGGQDLEPKQYGRVAVCLKPPGSATLVPNYLKNEIVDYLKDFIALPNRVIITDPDYFYIKVDSEVQFDKNATTKFASDIKTNVVANMLQFAADHIQKFGADFRYSKFVSHIDNTDTSITSNDTEIKMIKRITPLLNFPTPYVIEFNNTPEREGFYNGQVFLDERVFNSSTFTFVDSIGNEYPLSYLEDDGEGTINVWGYIDNVLTIVQPNVGFIDYETGRVIISNFIVSYYQDYISLYLKTKAKDIIANKSMVLLMESTDINITVIQTVK